MKSESLAITQEQWVPVDKAYLGVLRVGFSVAHFIGLATALVFAWLLPDPAHYFCFAIIALLLCSFLWLFFVWAAKSCARTRYLLREQDINLQQGYMFWKLVSVAHNRIQHLEVRQGPVERHYGLASLVIYTAGTLGSDLKIPGLTLAQAQQLKAQLLNSINAEALDANETL